MVTGALQTPILFSPFRGPGCLRWRSPAGVRRQAGSKANRTRPRSSQGRTRQCGSESVREGVLRRDGLTFQGAGTAIRTLAGTRDRGGAMVMLLRGGALLSGHIGRAPLAKKKTRLKPIVGLLRVGVCQSNMSAQKGMGKKRRSERLNCPRMKGKNIFSKSVTASRRISAFVGKYAHRRE